jgi:hypothetical protein
MSHAPDLVRTAEEGRSSYRFTVVPRAARPCRTPADADGAPFRWARKPGQVWTLT